MRLDLKLFRAFSISLRFQIVQKLITVHTKFRFASRWGNPRTFPCRARRIRTRPELVDRGWLSWKLDVTLKVMTREYYRCEMLRWDRVRASAANEKLPVRAWRCAHRTPKCTHLFTFMRRHNVSYIMLFLSRQCENKCETFKRPDCWFKRRTPLKI